MGTASSPKQTKSALEDIFIAAHIGTVLLSGIVIMVSETAQAGSISPLGVLFAMLLTFRTYAVSDWFVAFKDKVLQVDEPRHLRVYRFVSLGLIVLADIVMSIILFARQIPYWQITSLWIISMVGAGLRAIIVEPLRNDPDLRADVYLLMRIFDAIVWTIFTITLPLLYLSHKFHFHSLVLGLGMLPMMIVVMFVWELSTLPPKLSRELSSLLYRNLLMILCMISVVITILAVLSGQFTYPFILTAMIPLFSILVIKVLWENWSNFLWQLFKYVVIIGALVLVLVLFLSRYSIPN